MEWLLYRAAEYCPKQDLNSWLSTNIHYSQQVHKAYSANIPTWTKKFLYTALENSKMYIKKGDSRKNERKRAGTQ